MPYRVLLTGAAGYIGGMLCALFARRADVECIIGLDTAPMPQELRGNAKLRWVEANTADPSWRAGAAAARPDLVIHAAWQIRERHGRQAEQRHGNLTGSDAVFDFAFETPSVQRLLYFSSIAPYGADAGNSLARRFTEADTFRAGDFRYAEEKRLAEASLARKFAHSRARGGAVEVVVLRPAAVIGPRGRGHGVGPLTSALRAKEGLFGRLVSSFAFVPVTGQWGRQYVHEDDLADIAGLLAFGALQSPFDAFNIGPPGDVLSGPQLAEAFGVRSLRVPPQLLRLAFFLMWHGTRGRIGTPRGAWRSYAYPIVADAGKLTARYGVGYRMGSHEAFTRDVGRYAAAAAVDITAPAAEAVAR